MLNEMIKNTTGIYSQQQKRILVTGGARGIGKAIVLNLLKNGHKVASADIIDIELPTSIDTASLCKLIVDIRDKEAIDSSVHKVISEFGGLDVLVNVAGICYSGDPETIDAQECAETFDVNIKGMFYITAATLPYLKKEIRADIINISSIWGVEYNPSLISYSSSKFAVEGYTGGLRLWGMPQNIRVCSIQVDKVNTDFRRNFKGFPEIPPENLAKMLQPDDIASAVNFILSSSNTAQISSIRLDAPLWYQV